MKKKTKIERIESALKSLKDKNIISYWAKFDSSKNGEWEVSFDCGKNFKGIAVASFSAKDVIFSSGILDEVCVLIGMDRANHKVYIATANMIGKHIDKIDK